MKIISIFLIIFLYGNLLYAQEIYTARGYWLESTKETYRKIKQKQTDGIKLTDNETNYLQDYETYLASYYQRLSDAEKIRYEQMKAEWDRTIGITAQSEIIPEEFEWQARDRAANILYGIFYGASLGVVTEMDAGVATGVALATGGAWLLGPVINPKKYEGINRSVLRAGNTGKFLGLLYGGSLGLLIGGESESPEKFAFGMATVGSIALGEVGFQLQKKKNFSEGHIEMIKLYGVLGTWVGLSGFLATGSESASLAGATLLAGGGAGLLVGNKVSKGYSYTRGDVDAVSSLTWISTGLGFSFVASSLEDDDVSETLILVPAASSVLGTFIGQNQVKEAHLTKKQGSAINLSTAGAALVGLGILAIAESDSPGLWLGLPSGLALITHQIVLHKYKRDNILKGMQGRSSRNNDFKFSMNVMPENYFINKQLPVREFAPRNTSLVSNPIVNLKVSF